MNKKTKALTTEQYKEIIQTMREGFSGCRPNERIATALVLEEILGFGSVMCCDSDCAILSVMASGTAWRSWRRRQTSVGSSPFLLCSTSTLKTIVFETVSDVQK